MTAPPTSRTGTPEKMSRTSGDLPTWDESAHLTIVGKPHPRLEGVEKVTGRAQYTYDVRQPRQLYARVLRSPYPHAEITRIDTSKAAAMPGVHAVISAA